MSAIEYTMRHFCNVEQREYRCFPIDKFLAKAKYDGKPGIVCYQCKKEIVNQFGAPDFVYYYLIFKKDWHKYWAYENEANIPRYVKDKIPGGSLSQEIFDHMVTNPKVSLCSFVVGRPIDGDMKTREYYYCTANDLIAFHKKYGGLYEANYGQMDVGYPNTLFQMEDVFRSYHVR